MINRRLASSARRVLMRRLKVGNAKRQMFFIYSGYAKPDKLPDKI